MSSNAQLNVSSLFRSLKPESANADSMSPQAKQQSEQRWPLLKSLPPTKWPLTPALNDAEKRARRIEDSADQNLSLIRKPENLVPSIDSRIAEGVGRLLSKGKALFETTAVSINPTPVINGFSEQVSSPTGLAPATSNSHTAQLAVSEQQRQNFSPLQAELQQPRPSLFDNRANNSPAPNNSMQIESSQSVPFVSLFAQKTSAATSLERANQPSANQPSVRVILARIEQTKLRNLTTQSSHNTPQSNGIKPPGFFSRLGRR